MRKTNLEAQLETERKRLYQGVAGYMPSYDDIDVLSAMYTADGGSFAIVRHGSAWQRPGFVALTPRHMGAREWRALYAMEVTKLVVYGREISTDLCGACGNSFVCAQSGRGTQVGFKCKVSPKTLTFKIERKARGRDKTDAEFAKDSAKSSSR